MTNAGNTKWYYDVATGQVTEGPPESGWDNRMGPYDTREEAENALKLAAERNAAADAADKAGRTNSRAQPRCAYLCERPPSPPYGGGGRFCVAARRAVRRPSSCAAA